MGQDRDVGNCQTTPSTSLSLPGWNVETMAGDEAAILDHEIEGTY